MLSAFEANIEKVPAPDRVNLDRAVINDIMSRLELGSNERVRKASFKNVLVVSQLTRTAINQYLANFSEQLFLATNASIEDVEVFLYRTYDLEDLMRRPLLLEMVVQTILAGKLDITKTRTEIGYLLNPQLIKPGFDA